MASVNPLDTLAGEIESCRACPRLVVWREQVAATKRAAFADERYWGRPVAGFGDPSARLWVVGLAPAAHGANRTGRVFTGDRSGDWLFRAMHRAGFANQPTSTDPGDGLRLLGAWVSAAVRCAPPQNRPSPVERDTCAPYLAREMAALANVQVVVALGAFAHESVLRLVGVRRRPRFGHGAEAGLELVDGRRWHLISSFHPSQQNTFTGRLTEVAFDSVFSRARDLVDGQASQAK
ncbi:MAG: uracil-DNA glycosylase [Acidimicrobiales bacterium]